MVNLWWDRGELWFFDGRYLWAKNMPRILDLFLRGTALWDGHAMFRINQKSSWRTCPHGECNARYKRCLGSAQSRSQYPTSRLAYVGHLLLPEERQWEEIPLRS